MMGRMKIGWLIGLTAAALLAGPFAGGNRAFADEIWNMYVKAKAFADAGNKAEAAPNWDELLNHYVSEEDWQNAAIYAGYLDEYYDSIKDYDKAISYYERENDYWTKYGVDWGAPDIERAEQIRTTVEPYISTSDKATLKAQAAPKSGNLAKFEPEYGMYIGLYSEQDKGMGNFFTKSKELYGKNHALYLCYTQWDLDFPARYAENAKEAGSGLQIAFQPNGGLDQVVDGPYLREWARQAKASGIPIFLRFASEMNGN